MFENDEFVLFNGSRCKRASLECERGDIDCYRKPATITYHFITLISNLALPPTGRILFTYRGPSWYQNVDFEMKLVHAQSRSDVRRADDKYFRCAKGHFEHIANSVSKIHRISAAFFCK